MSKNIDRVIEKFKDLPSKSSMKYIERGDKRDRWYSWNKGHGVYRKINNKFPWTHVERTLKAFKGKNVDKAFSAYCKIVDQCQQYMFWDEFDTDRKYRYYKWDYPYWYIDKNKCVQRYQPKKKNTGYSIYSHDIKWGYIHKETGEKVDGNDWRMYNNENWENGVIEGEIFTFSRKGRAFHRCYAEQLSKRRSVSRADAILASEKEYSFLTREEEQQIEDRKNDEVIKESHGFTDESFTNKGGRLNKD